LIDFAWRIYCQSAGAEISLSLKPTLLLLFVCFPFAMRVYAAVIKAIADRF